MNNQWVRAHFKCNRVSRARSEKSKQGNIRRPQKWREMETNTEPKKSKHKTVYFYVNFFFRFFLFVASKRNGFSFRVYLCGHASMCVYLHFFFFFADFFFILYDSFGKSLDWPISTTTAAHHILFYLFIVCQTKQKKKLFYSPIFRTSLFLLHKNFRRLFYNWVLNI